MSQNPVDSPIAELDEAMTRTPSASHSLADYEDISGEFQQPLSRTTSIATQVAQEDVQEPLRRLSPTPEVDAEVDADVNEESAELARKLQQEHDADEFVGAVAMASMVIVGGMILGALALYLNRPLTIEHPLTRGDYF